MNEEWALERVDEGRQARRRRHVRALDALGAEPGVGIANEVAQVGERIASSASSRRIMKCRFASGTWWKPR